MGKGKRRGCVVEDERRSVFLIFPSLSAAALFCTSFVPVFME